jgi:hypothetical protein
MRSNLSTVEAPRPLAAKEPLPPRPADARDERGVPAPFTLIAASRKDNQNGPRQNLSFPFIAPPCNGGSPVLQLKTNTVNKIANLVFCGPLVSLQNVAFLQSTIAQFLKKSTVAIARGSRTPDMEPIFDHFSGARSPFHNTSTFWVSPEPAFFSGKCLKLSRNVSSLAGWLFSFSTREKAPESRASGQNRGCLIVEPLVQQNASSIRTGWNARGNLVPSSLPRRFTDL